MPQTSLWMSQRNCFFLGEYSALLKKEEEKLYLNSVLIAQQRVIAARILIPIGAFKIIFRELLHEGVFRNVILCPQSEVV